MARVLAGVFSAFLLVVMVGACSTGVVKPVTTRNSELTHGNVQMHLQVGKTTQAEVLEVFGAPNITTIDGSGQEVWVYQRHATVAQAESRALGGGGGVGDSWIISVFGGAYSAAGFEQTQRTITLIIKFDKNKVVSDFRSRASEF